ncbi:histidine-tRNA ligase [Salvia divinorum]|uniref:Histidine-tRNA ligase n=1 Tax=Salvia divinorum TaxID=28513 RepID=A0ABD1HE28_SALDI
MSNGEVRKVSVQDIQLVQILIERCLQLYMSEREVVNTLLHQAKIEPGFTEIVWRKLESENQEFFRAYQLRLIVKDQILRFNQLLERQVELMRQVCPTRINSMSLSNGSQMHSMRNNSGYQVQQPAGLPIKPENMHQAVTLPNVYTNGVSALQPTMQVPVSMSGHGGRIDLPENMLLTQNSSSGIVQGMNGVMIKSEGGFAGDSHFMFGTENNLIEPRNTIGEAFVSPFTSGDTNESMLDQEMSSFGFLGQIPRNFSLSDLTADFSNSTDILESYSRSPFLGTDANFLDSHVRSEQQDARRLDTISEGLGYDDFASD